MSPHRALAIFSCPTEEENMLPSKQSGNMLPSKPPLRKALRGSHTVHVCHGLSDIRLATHSRRHALEYSQWLICSSPNPEAMQDPRTEAEKPTAVTHAVNARQQPRGRTAAAHSNGDNSRPWCGATEASPRSRNKTFPMSQKPPLPQPHSLRSDVSPVLQGNHHLPTARIGLACYAL